MQINGETPAAYLERFVRGYVADNLKGVYVSDDTAAITFAIHVAALSIIQAIEAKK